MITRIKWINIPFFSNDCWFFGMSIMRTLEMHYQCESQVQQSLLFGLTSYAMFVSQNVLHCWNFIPQLSAFMLTRALPLPWRSMQFLGGILLLSTNLFILFVTEYSYTETYSYTDIHISFMDLAACNFAELIILKVFFSCFFFGRIQCLLT